MLIFRKNFTKNLLPRNQNLILSNFIRGIVGGVKNSFTANKTYLLSKVN